MSPASVAARSDMLQKSPVEGHQSGPNFSLVQLGPAAELSRYEVQSPRSGLSLSGKVFLHGLLDLTGMEISYGLLPPQTSFPFYHKHKQNEEVYLILSGSGQYQVDGEVLEIREGSAIRVAPDGVRAFRNTSDAPMFYLCIQAKAGSLERWTGTDGIGIPGTVAWPEAASQD